MTHLKSVVIKFAVFASLGHWRTKEDLAVPLVGVRSMAVVKFLENTAPDLGILGAAFNWRQEAAQHYLVLVAAAVVAVEAMVVAEDAVVAEMEVVALMLAEDLMVSIAYILLLSVADVLTVVLAAEDLVVSVAAQNIMVALEVNKDHH